MLDVVVAVRLHSLHRYQVVVVVFDVDFEQIVERSVVVVVVDDDDHHFVAVYTETILEQLQMLNLLNVVVIEKRQSSVVAVAAGEY
jgi:hypothetical protein